MDNSEQVIELMYKAAQDGAKAFLFTLPPTKRPDLKTVTPEEYEDTGLVIMAQSSGFAQLFLKEELKKAKYKLKYHNFAMKRFSEIEEIRELSPFTQLYCFYAKLNSVENAKNINAPLA